MSARGKRGGLRGRSRDPLSRNERERVFGTETGFTPPQDFTRCPDCRSYELEADVRLATPKRSHPRIWDCETCFGAGVVPLLGKTRLDPYMTPHAVAMAM